MKQLIAKKRQLAAEAEVGIFFFFFSEAEIGALGKGNSLNIPHLFFRFLCICGPHTLLFILFLLSCVCAAYIAGVLPESVLCSCVGPRIELRLSDSAASTLPAEPSL